MRRGSTTETSPLVGGDLILQVASGSNVREQIAEVNFQLRRIQRGGRQ
jgi:hypothetical protein